MTIRMRAGISSMQVDLNTCILAVLISLLLGTIVGIVSNGYKVGAVGNCYVYPTPRDAFDDRKSEDEQGIERLRARIFVHEVQEFVNERR